MSGFLGRKNFLIPSRVVRDDTAAATKASDHPRHTWECGDKGPRLSWRLPRLAKPGFVWRGDQLGLWSLKGPTGQSHPIPGFVQHRPSCLRLQAAVVHARTYGWDATGL